IEPLSGSSSGLVIEIHGVEREHRATIGASALTWYTSPSHQGWLGAGLQGCFPALLGSALFMARIRGGLYIPLADPHQPTAIQCFFKLVQPFAKKIAAARLPAVY